MGVKVIGMIGTNKETGKTALIVTGRDLGITGCHIIGKLAEIVPAIEAQQTENPLPNIENGIDTSIKARFDIHALPQIDMPFIPYEPKRIFRQHHHVKKNKKRK